MMGWRAYLVVFLFSYSAELLASVSSIEVYRNNEAVQKIEAEDLSQASAILHDLVAKNPNLGVPRLNLAGIYLQNQDNASSRALLQDLLRSLLDPAKQKNFRSLEERDFLFFVVYFNLGYLSALEKESWAEALAYYRQALNYQADDLATKLNIELLVEQQMQSASDSGGDSSEDKDKQKDQQKKDSQDSSGKEQKPQDKKDPEKDQQDSQDKKYADQKKAKKPQFKENELNKQDVKRIFEELKRQEEKIRAKMNEQNQQESNNEKDW